MNRAVNLYIDAVVRRNDVLGEGIVDVARATARAFGKLRRSLATTRQRRAWIGKLNGLNDHLLRDIGLARHEIPGHVNRHIGGVAVPSARPAPVGYIGRSVRAAGRWLRARRDARSTARQLHRLDDRLLADIGLEAGDIDWLARDLALRSLAEPANDNRDRDAA